MELKTAIIGLGQIGMGYDYELNSTGLSHASALQRSSFFELVGAVDVDANKIKNFEGKYKSPGFKRLEDLLIECRPELIVIASPTQTHQNILNQVIDFKVKKILCEKPLSNHWQDSEEMVKNAEKNNCHLLTNYIRRFDPGFCQIKNWIHQEKFGKIIKSVFWYTGDLLHSGCHIVDLLRFFWGEPNQIHSIDPHSQWSVNVSNLNPSSSIENSTNKSEAKNDIFIDCGFEFDHHWAYLLSTGKCESPNFNFEIIGSMGKVRLSWDQNQLEIYFNDQTAVEIIPTELNQYQHNVYRRLEKYFAGDITDLPNFANETIQSERIVHQIINCELK